VFEIVRHDRGAFFSKSIKWLLPMNILLLEPPRVPRVLLSFLCLLAVTLLLAAPAAAQEEETAINLTAEAGYDGYYKGECWVPIQVTVANNGPAIEGALQVAIGSNFPGAENQVIYSSPISLATQSNKRVTLYVYLPAVTTSVSVQLVDGDGDPVVTVRSGTLIRANLDSLLYGVVSSEPDELSFLEDVKGERADAAVAFIDLTDLPEAGAALNALDVLVFHDVDTAELSAGQLEGLQGWLETGGQLVVTGGPNWQRTTATLAEWLPVTVTGSESVSDLPALSTRAGVPFRDPGPYVVATSSLRSGEALLHQDGMPLLARQNQGRGAVYFLALDPKLAPLVDWDGNVVVWGEIAGVAPRMPHWAIGAQNSYAAGAAVETLPSLALPSTLALMFFLVAYVMIVGPVNYFVLRRMQRRELAWMTIPAIVLFFTAVAYLTGFQIKGNEIIINQMSIAYGRTDGEQMRVQTLVGLYSPRRAVYDLVFPGGSLVRPFDRNAGTLSGGGNTGPVEQGAEVTVQDVRVDVSGVQTFVADSYRPLPEISGQTVLRIENNRLQLEIEVQNDSEVTLQNVGLLLGSTMVSLGDLEPGENRSETRMLSSGQAGAAIGGGGGMTPAFSSSGLGFPTDQHLTILLGTSSYYGDRDIEPRLQLLQSLSPNYGATAGWLPVGVVTLVGWAEEQQLPLSLDGREADQLATTLYFLELPFSQVIASGEGVTIPAALLDWRVLGESGVYNPTPNDLSMSQGWVEFEFQPWPEFATMNVTELSIELRRESSFGSSPVPEIRLWEWAEEDWVVLDNVEWGRMVVGDYGPYIGPNNAVRIRVQNSDFQTIYIEQVYPRLTGDLR
jgi:hypothetical protein